MSSVPPPPRHPLPWETEEPRAVIQRTGTRERGFQAWEYWVSHGPIKYASEWGSYAWSRRRAERGARKLLRRYQASCRGPIEDVT